GISTDKCKIGQSLRINPCKRAPDNARAIQGNNFRIENTICNGEIVVEIFEQKIMAFIMFSRKAEEAMHFYTSIFTELEIITRYEADQGGEKDAILYATFSIKG